MTIVGNRAVVSLSRPRENHTFEGLILNKRLEREGCDPKWGLFIISLETGEVEHRLEIEGVVQDLYDIAVPQEIMRPSQLSFQSNEICFSLRPEPAEVPVRAEAQLN